MSGVVHRANFEAAVADLQRSDQIGIQCLWGDSGQLDSLQVCLHLPVHHLRIPPPCYVIY